MNAFKLWVSVCVAVVGLSLVSTASAVSADIFSAGFSIDFVPISGSTNPASGYGIVNNDYRMGTLEITNDQWNKFKAAYGPVKGSPSSGYLEDSYWTDTNLTTNMTSWLEAAQFVNYLNTSTGHQPAYKFTGTQGTSNYTFSTWSAAEADNGTNLYRHKDAFYYLPTEDEWVKAAYWNGTSLQTWATKDDSPPVAGVDSMYGQTHPFDGPWNVGSGSEELNGTYNMMGNIYEWMESPYNDPSYSPYTTRGARGGSYDSNSGYARSSVRLDLSPIYESYRYGFRVAADVPEPSSMGLILVGGLALLKRRRGA